MANVEENFDELMQAVFKQGASDLHITAGRRPTLRVDGSLMELAKFPVTTPDSAKDFVFAILNDRRKEKFLQEKELDFSYGYKDKGPKSLQTDHGLEKHETHLVAKAETPGLEMGLPRRTFVNQEDAPVCDTCGSITVRNGACYRCHNCGNSMGCS